MSSFGLKFDYFHKILLNAFIATDGVFVGKYKEKATPTVTSLCRDLNVKDSAFTNEMSDFRRSGILIEIGRSAKGGKAYDINYNLIDPEQLIITKQEYLDKHHLRSPETSRSYIRNMKYQDNLKKLQAERSKQQQSYLAKEERERVKAEKENEKKLKFCDDQKVKAFGIYDSYCDWVIDNAGSNDSKFFDRSTASLKDIFDSIVLLAGAHLSVWFDEYGVPSYEGHTENKGHEYYKFVLEFVRLCIEFELIDDCIQEKTFHLHRHIKHPISEELANYWNFNNTREDGRKNPLDSVRIFFYTCIIGGTWNFVHCQKIYNEKEKELQEELKRKEEESAFNAPNVFNFADYKKKIS